MIDANYEQKVEKIKSEAKGEGEKNVNKLFLDLGFNFIDCNIIVKRNRQEIGEIDGLFKLKDDYLLILEIDNEKKLPSKKIGEFYSKWTNKKNIEIILNRYGIPQEIEVIKIFISYKNETPSEGPIKESLRHHFDDHSNKILYIDDVEYFQKSFSIIGRWAKNDLINFIELHKKRAINLCRKPALRILIGNRRAYLFSATAYELLEACYIYRRGEKVPKGYQRILKEKRINNIKKAIEKPGVIAFPNSFIISSRYKLEESPDEKTGSCTIAFPIDYCSCRVVDGQHRLLGFANTEESIQKNHNLPVVAFDDMKETEEARTFIIINTEQQKINPNLLLILKSGFDWDKGTKFFNEKQAVLVIKKLNEVKSSPLYRKIFLGYNPPRAGKITLATLVSAVLGNNLIAGSKHLLQSDVSDLETPYKEIKGIFYEMRRSLPNYCNLKKIKQTKGFFFSNKGLRIIFRLIQFLIRNKQKGNIQIEPSELFEDLSSIINNGLVDDLQKYYGEGGATKATEGLMKRLKRTKKEKYKKFKIHLKQI